MTTIIRFLLNKRIHRNKLKLACFEVQTTNWVSNISAYRFHLLKFNQATCVWMGMYYWLIGYCFIDASCPLSSNVAGDIFFICKFNILMMCFIIKKENAVNLIVCVRGNAYCKTILKICN